MRNMTNQNYSLPIPLWGKAIEEKPVEQLYKIHGNNSSFSFNILSSDWDSKHISKNVYRISNFSSNTADDTSSVSLHDWESSINKPSIVWARLASEAGDAIRALESEQFRYTSGLNSYIWKASDISFSPKVKIRKATQEDANEIGIIGENAFSFDRLYLDPAIQNIVAKNMYREWSSNCVKGLCDEVLVAEVNNEIAGFISLTTDSTFSSTLNASYKRIVLVAVSPLHRGQGIGVQLVNAAKAWTYSNHNDYLLVGTSSVNVPAQNLYFKCNFSPYYSELALSKSFVNKGEIHGF